MSLSGIIHHSHSFTRLEIYHHIYFKVILILTIPVKATEIGEEPYCFATDCCQLFRWVFKLTVESNFAFALVLVYLAL